MTHTITRQVIHPQMLRMSRSQGNSGRPQQRWIYLSWRMLSSTARNWSLGSALGRFFLASPEEDERKNQDDGILPEC
jgi:hypothetical protein